MKFLILKTEGCASSKLIKFTFNNCDFEIKNYSTILKDF